MPRELSLAVVGADYPNKRGPSRLFEIELCLPGESVELRREPNNPADPRAIAVFSARGIQIGYVPAEKAQYVGTLIGRYPELRAVFQRKASRGAIIRVNLAGDIPTLPPVPVVTDQPPEWWPDEISDDQ